MSARAPYYDCPQFEGCSRNHCPLDPERGLRENLPDDPDTKCRARIIVRQEIAEGHQLAGHGMTEKEIRRAERKAKWDALPQGEKEKRLARLKPFTKRTADEDQTRFFHGWKT